MISNYKVKVNDSCNYKVSITDIQNKYKFKLFCAGADLTDYYTKEQVDQSQNTQDILIDNILNQIPTGTATGETINITDSSSLPLKDIQVAGNTYQETTTGKNLLNLTSVTTTTSTSTASLTNGEVTVNWTGGFNLDLYDIISNLDTSKTYTVSFKHKGDALWLRNKSVSATDILETSVDNDYTLYTLSLTNISAFQFRFIRKTNTGTAYIKDIQLEENSSATSYEKYTGGNPAPNPDYPQAITNVTGTNTIKIVGKNLFDGILEKSNWNSVIGSTMTHGISTDQVCNTNKIQVKPNTIYKLSIDGTAIDVNARYIYADENNIVLSSEINSTGTITTPANCKYVGFHSSTLYSRYGTNIPNMQLEENSTATTYEAYKEQSYTINLGNIELCKIGDYKDRIYNSGGKWYLEKNISKVVLNGTETTGSVRNTGTSNWYYVFSNLTQNTPSDNGEYIISSHYKGNSIYNNNTNTGICATTTSKELRIRYGTENTIANFKTWLVNNNVTVYYVLTTPTTTEITDATLVSQLDTLLNSTTYKTTTNIMVDTTNQKPTLTLTYRKDLETLIGG